MRGSLVNRQRMGRIMKKCVCGRRGGGGSGADTGFRKGGGGGVRVTVNY